MTAPQTIRMIQMLLDDGSFWFSHLTEVLRTINEAQLIVLKEAIASMDEYALRQSYRYAETVHDGDTVVAAVTGEYLFYPRVVRVRKDTETQAEDSELASYLTPELYSNFLRLNSWYPGGRYPRSLHYTIKSEYDSGSGLYEPKLYFNSPDVNANAFIWFICIPREFIWTPNVAVTHLESGLTDIPLQITEGLHPAVCLKAAELLNDKDTEEMQRSNRTQAEQYVPYEKAGL